MTEPTPQAVMSTSSAGQKDKTVVSPVMRQTSRAIMMPGSDMPQPRHAGPSRPKTAGRSPQRQVR